MIIVYIENDATPEEMREAAKAVDFIENADERQAMIDRAWANFR